MILASANVNFGIKDWQPGDRLFAALARPTTPSLTLLAVMCAVAVFSQLNWPRSLVFATAPSQFRVATSSRFRFRNGASQFHLTTGVAISFGQTAISFLQTGIVANSFATGDVAENKTQRCSLRKTKRDGSRKTNATMQLAENKTRRCSLRKTKRDDAGRG